MQNLHWLLAGHARPSSSQKEASFLSSPARETSAGDWPMLMTHFRTLRLPSTPRSKQRDGALELGPKALGLTLTQVLPCR